MRRNPDRGLRRFFLVTDPIQMIIAPPVIEVRRRGCNQVWVSGAIVGSLPHRRPGSGCSARTSPDEQIKEQDLLLHRQILHD